MKQLLQKKNHLAVSYFLTAQEKPQQGTVVAVGPGKVSDAGTLVNMSVKEGDKILYGKYSGTEVNVAGTDYIIMRESDILATM